LPPLPPAFHDLYASTVRTAPRDDPALHQGRTRQIPHVPGLWPSHVYVEWRPPPPVHALLCELLARLQQQQQVELQLPQDSDVGVPQPLHVSLSRPLALSTEQKAQFLSELEAALAGGGGRGQGGGGSRRRVTSFSLRCSRVEWHRTTESGRSFLVLREEEGEEEEGNVNPELTELLRRCNEVAERHGQPALYRWAEEEAVDQADKRVGEAFHVSIAWSFAEPTEELVRATERVFGSQEIIDKIREIEIPVEGVKVKIGNVVTHVALE
ncbi:U6 snRNA phosphodiesterase Usb1, partial [Thermothelomyces heterothallicus CBS 202.75]|uniref:U6 snRNA phosphodiesterase Usb1 n=1 Tax=Thermothelomyces heterothallicus CBS 202.75 TaxID=1149848 RepID=UPI00374371D2